MMRVTGHDGSTFAGENEVEIVRKMRAFQWEAPEKKRDYMDEVCDRVQQMMGFAVRNDPHGFIEDLETLGLLKVERR